MKFKKFRKGFLKLLSKGSCAIEKRIFGRNDPEYQPSKHLLNFVFFATMVVDVIMFCLQFYDKEWLNPMAFWCVTLVCCINILIAMPSIFKCNSVSRKIGFFAFAVVMTFVAAAIVFYVVWLVISIIFGIWLLKGLWHVLNEPPMTSSGSAAMASVSGGSGGSASGGSGDILLSNGDTVRYDAMTGDYRSTNPTVDNYYKKDGNDFVQR